MKNLEVLLEMFKLEKGIYNEQAQSIVNEYQKVSEATGLKGMIIAGGSVIDAAYQLDNYDYDCYINANGFRPNFILSVKTIRKYDIVEISNLINAKDYIAKYFDQNIKKCWYDGERFYFSDECKRDVLNGVLTVDLVASPAVYFRALRAMKKYNLEIKKNELEKLRHFTGWCLLTKAYTLSRKYNADICKGNFEDITIYDQIAIKTDRENHMRMLENVKLYNETINKEEEKVEVLTEVDLRKKDYHEKYSHEEKLCDKKQCGEEPCGEPIRVDMTVPGYGHVETYDKKDKDYYNGEGDNLDELIPIEEICPVTDNLLKNKIWRHNVGTNLLERVTITSILSSIENVINIDPMAQLACMDVNEKIADSGVFVKGNTVAVSLSDCYTRLMKNGKRYIPIDNEDTFVAKKEEFLSHKDSLLYGRLDGYCEAVVEDVKVVGIWCRKNYFFSNPSVRYNLLALSEKYKIKLYLTK